MSQPAPARQEDVIDLKPGIQLGSGSAGSVFGLKVPGTGERATEGTSSTDRPAPDTGDDVAKGRGDTRGRKVTAGEFDRGHRLADLLDPWKDLGSRPDTHGAGPKNTSGTDLLDRAGANPTNSTGKNHGASDDTGHGRHYFHGGGHGIPSWAPGAQRGQQGSEDSSHTSSGRPNDARDALDAGHTRTRESGGSGGSAKTEMSAEWWDQMSGGTLHNEQEARAEAERQLWGAAGDMTEAERNAYIQDQAEFQRAGIKSVAEAKEMQARQEKELASGQVYTSGGSSNSTPSSGSGSSGDKKKPAPDATDGTPTPLDPLFDDSGPSVTEQEEARRRQVQLPGEGSRERERIYMDRDEINRGFISRQTDGRSQPVTGDGTTDGGGGTSLGGQYSPRPGNLGDPAPTEEGGTNGDPLHDEP